MKQVQKLQQLNNLSYFDTNTVAQLTGLEGNNLYKNIIRWLKQGALIKLKRGVYTTDSYFKQLDDKNTYLEFITNKLRYPSYLSLEYVLSKGQVLTETVYSYTAITQKTTRAYSNELGTFSYRNISDKLFTGFKIIKKNGFEIAIASKAKALFDYIYLKMFRKSLITIEMLNDLRLNLEEFTKEDAGEFSKYCELSNIQKYKNLPYLLFPKK